MSSETKAKYLERRRAYYKNNKPRQEQQREWNLKTKYDLTIEAYDNILEEQNGVCAICHKKPKVFHVDHSHIQGHVRGILCQKCNILLGHANDNPEILMAAIEYLNKSWN